MKKSYKITWSRSAHTDLDTIIDYIIAHGEEINARKVYLKIIRKIQRLKQFPFSGRIPPEMQEMGIKEFRELIVAPYRVFFRVYEREVVLVGILDGRRDLAEILIERVMVAG